MSHSDDALRELINGERPPPPSPERLDRFDEGQSATARRTRAALIAGVVTAALGAVLVTAGLLGGSAAPEAQLGPAVRTQGPNPLTASIADGGAVPRVIPQELGGRTPVVETSPARSEFARRQPVPLAAPEEDPALFPETAFMLPDDSAPAALPEADAEAEPAPLSTPPAVEKPAALIVAASNLVWSRLFHDGGHRYEPVHLVDAAFWGEGGCAHRAMPDLPIYCVHDRSVYFDPQAMPTVTDLFAVAHEIGRHVQDVLGVKLRPLEEPARSLQADCFAGLWARHDALAGHELTPGLLGTLLRVGERYNLRGARRHQAFVIGYQAEDVMECDGIGPQTAGPSAPMDAGAPSPR